MRLVMSNLSEPLGSPHASGDTLFAADDAASGIRRPGYDSLFITISSFSYLHFHSLLV
jgi:hypothetical protein